MPLKYDYAAYEPLIDGETMRLHHSGHYKAYTDNLNAALREAETCATGTLHSLVAAFL